MAVLFKSRNVAKAATAAKRKPIDLPASKRGNEDDDESSQDDNDDEQENIIDRRNKRIKKSNNSSVSSVDIGEVKFDHSHSITTSNNDEATKQSALYSEEEVATTKDNLGPSIDGIYHGTENYSSFLTKREGISSKTRFGPMKASGNIRSTTMIDYQPDVCKDYKQTGYCGYGDSCKFLHSREDYKAGWKLDKDWEEVQKKFTNKEISRPREEEEVEKEDKPPIIDIPFKCVICKNDYKDPIVTQCEHYFCESCFFKEFRKNGGCFICGKNTGGIAKPAKNLKKLLS